MVYLQEDNKDIMTEEQIKDMQKGGIKKAREYLQTRKKRMSMSSNIEGELLMIQCLKDVGEDVSEFTSVIGTSPHFR